MVFSQDRINAAIKLIDPRGKCQLSECDGIARFRIAMARKGGALDRPFLIRYLCTDHINAFVEKRVEVVYQ